MRIIHVVVQDGRREHARTILVAQGYDVDEGRDGELLFETPLRDGRKYTKLLLAAYGVDAKVWATGHRDRETVAVTSPSGVPARRRRGRSRDDPRSGREGVEVASAGVL